MDPGEMDALLPAAADFASYPGMHGEDAVRQFLEQFPLPKLLGVLQSEADVSETVETVAACLDKVFSSRYGASLLPSYGEFIQAGLLTNSNNIRQLACKAVVHLLDKSGDSAVAVDTFVQHNLYPLLINCLIEGDEEMSAIVLDAIKRLAEIPKGTDIIFPPDGQGLQLNKVAAQSSSMLAEHPHSNMFVLKTSLLQLITDVINDSSADSIVRSRASLISGRLLSSADAFMTVEQYCVTNLLLAIDKILRMEESQNTDEIESALETLGLIGTTTQGARLLFSDQPNVAKHVVEMSFDRQGRRKQLNSSASIAEGTQLSTETDLSPEKPLQPGMLSTGISIIGQRSLSDFVATGDNPSGTSAASGHGYDEIASTCKRLQQKKPMIHMDFWFIGLLLLMITLVFLPSVEGRQLAQISDPEFCSDHKLVSNRIGVACIPVQPLVICCELLVSALDFKGCLCKVITDGMTVDVLLTKYLSCGVQYSAFAEEIKNCSSPDKPAPAPTPEVAEVAIMPNISYKPAPTPEVAEVAIMPSKSKILSLPWLLVLLVLVAIAGLLFVACVLKKRKDAGKVTPQTPQTELTGRVTVHARRTADNIISHQDVDIPIPDDVPFLGAMTRSRFNSLKDRAVDDDTIKKKAQD